MKKTIRWWRIVLYILTGVGFIVTSWWYVGELNVIFADATTEQIIQAVDFTVLSTYVEAEKQYVIPNAPIIFGFVCIALWPLIIGFDYILRHRDKHG